MKEPYRNCMWTAAGYDCMGNKESNWSAWPYTVTNDDSCTLSYAVTNTDIIIIMHLNTINIHKHCIATIAIPKANHIYKVSYYFVTTANSRDCRYSLI